MADACVFLMESRNFKDTIGGNASALQKEIRNTHINIGTGEDISIKELANMIKKIVDYHGELYFNSDKPDGTMIKLTDPSKVANSDCETNFPRKLHELGWKHKVELEAENRVEFHSSPKTGGYYVK